MIHDVKGNLLDTGADIICQQINCQGVMGKGLANQIKKKWPIVYERYRKKVYDCKKQSPSYMLLGEIQPVALDAYSNTTGRQMFVINMFAQREYGTGARQTNYEAFYACLEKIAKAVPDTKSIAFPARIGCGLGGGNWKVIRTMIEEVLHDKEVYIYDL